MTIEIQALIDKRPHLKDPLELYARWQRFHHETAALLPKERAMSSTDSKGYPRDIAAQVFQLFVSIFDLPGMEFEPLGQALADGDIDFMRLPLNEIPALLDLSCSDEELTKVLFLFARPYFLALRETFPLDGSEWKGGRCPLCSAQAALASIIEGPKRLLHCSFCGTTGPYRFIGCPNCESTDTATLNTIVSEDEPGFRIATCDACHTYVKVVENPALKEMAIDLADLASIPLDIVAQDKGYARMAPNPISLKKMG
ncbi:MAG: formate dehydrogenase accessory protein FdhE [Proteobacteria bacterium]|nr:formate dehydrogenase accessory protein FdhE [Pseudomonadota bacterium]